MPLHVSNSSFILVLHQDEWQKLNPNARNIFLEDAIGFSRADSRVVEMEFSLADPQLFVDILGRCHQLELNFGLIRGTEGGAA